MKNFAFFIALVLLFLSLAAPMCSSDDDDDDNDAANDDINDSVNNDLNDDIDDDLNDDIDDDVDDDLNDDSDDDVDDDIDDDVNDDIDDDLNDDINDDVNDDIDDDVNDDLDDDIIEDLSIELVAGGDPGQSGTDIAVGLGGEIYIAAARGRLSYYELILYHGQADQPTEEWASEKIVDGASDPVIVMDEGDFIHLAFYDPDNQDLMYAANTSGAWIKEAVDSQGNVGRRPSMAIDEYGFAHISYFDESNQDLKYATNESGSWTAQLVDSANEVGYHSAIGVHGGIVKIAYNDKTTDELKFAQLSGRAWDIEAVDSYSFKSARTLDLALDEAGQPNIAYHSEGDLNHAVLDNDTWSISVIDEYYYEAQVEAHYTALEIQIAFGPDGKLYVAFHAEHYTDWDDYYDDWMGCLKGFRIAYLEDDAWNIVEVDPWWETGPANEKVGFALSSDAERGLRVHMSGHISSVLKYDFFDLESAVWTDQTVARSYDCQVALAVDGDDYAHLFYSNNQYVHNKDGRWSEPQSIDGAAYHISPVVDADDAVHIAYGNGGLRFAHNCSGIWSSEPVDEHGGGYQSLALDSNGKAHIAYHVQNAVKYATNLYGDWVHATVDVTNPDDWTPNGHPDIFVDSGGYAHMSYWQIEEDKDVKKMRYATNTGGAWAKETVVESAVISGYPTIVVDGGQNVWISYTEYTSGDVRKLMIASNLTGSWESYPAYEGGETYYFADMDMGPDGDMHLFFKDFEVGTLNYAFYTCQGWISSPIDSAYACTDGFQNTMAVGRLGVYAVYYDQKGIWFASWPNGYFVE